MIWLSDCSIKYYIYKYNYISEAIRPPPPPLPLSALFRALATIAQLNLHLEIFNPIINLKNCERRRKECVLFSSLYKSLQDSKPLMWNIWSLTSGQFTQLMRCQFTVFRVSVMSFMPTTAFYLHDLIPGYTKTYALCNVQSIILIQQSCETVTISSQTEAFLHPFWKVWWPWP